MAEEMTVFAVNGDEVFWFNELQDELLLFLAGMAGDVDGAAGVVVIDQGAAAEHVIEHAENGFFVSGDDPCRKDHGIVFVDRDEAMTVDSNAREGRHWFGLAATGENDQAFGIEAANVLRANDHAVGDTEIFEGVGDFDVVDHAAADEGDFAANARGDVDHLLDAMDRGGEARKDDAARGGATKLFDTRDYIALGAGEAGAF